MNNTIYRIRRYRELKADIFELNLRLTEIEEEMLGVSGQSGEESTGKTYKITSSTENQAEKLIDKKDEVFKSIKEKQRELDRIDNAMSILLDEEREIISIAHIEHKPYWKLEEKLNRSYARIKQIEHDAIAKMRKYIP